MSKTSNANVDALRFGEQGSAPGTPSAGYGLIYFKTTGRIYAKNDAGSEYDLTGLGGSGATTVQLIEWTEAESYQMTSITWDSDGVISSAAVQWPDGSAGTFTRTTKNTTWMAIDAYTIGHSDSGQVVTQPVVTRDSNGNVITKPVLTVA